MMRGTNTCTQSVKLKIDVVCCPCVKPRVVKEDSTDHSYNLIHQSVKL